MCHTEYEGNDFSPWVSAQGRSFMVGRGGGGCQIFRTRIGFIRPPLCKPLPSLLIAVAGPLIERNLPHALSLSEFSGWRFGLVPQIGML